MGEQIPPEVAAAASRLRQKGTIASRAVAWTFLGIVWGLVGVTQVILHYLGLCGIVLGVIALLVGNTDRGIELVIGGLSFIVLKYVVGWVFALPLVLIAMFTKKDTDR